MKRSLAGGFSNKALLEQEQTVQGCVDKFINKIEQAATGKQGLNMTDWYEMLAFDVLGEMAFGESFHCIDDGLSSLLIHRLGQAAHVSSGNTGKPHFWQQMISKHLFFITVVDNLRRYPLVRQLGQWILPNLTVAIRDKHTGYSRKKVAQ